MFDRQCRKAHVASLAPVTKRVNWVGIRATRVQNVEYQPTGNDANGSINCGLGNPRVCGLYDVHITPGPPLNQGAAPGRVPSIICKNHYPQPHPGTLYEITELFNVLGRFLSFRGIYCKYKNTFYSFQYFP